MTALVFNVEDSRVEPHAAVPTLMLRTRVRAAEGQGVHAAALRCQVRIEPQRRVYQPAEEERLYELFGATPQWGDSLRPFLWTHVSVTLGGFEGECTFDLPLECSYDFEVAAAKYLHGLEGGEVPLLLLFSGTVFFKSPTGFAAERLSWGAEATYRLPVARWRELMDHYFPNSGWLRVRRDVLDRLQRYRVGQALPTWDQALERLLKEAGVDEG
jgi:hypothetical protein